jgi:chemotaxis protein histidine kinase CheA
MPQARKSSIHFAPVTNIKFAVSHSERTELSEPKYLLPPEHRLPNVLVAGSLSESDLTTLFTLQKEGMTGQAKARGSSPFWEGVLVLPNTDANEQSANLLEWKKAYEKATGHQVLHLSIHLDEGYLDAAGQPQYNPHAHIIVSRMNEKNRVIQLKRKQLGEVQDLTAEILQMDRGSTLKERGGKRGRIHIGHKEFRIMADEARLDLEKETNKKDWYGNLLDYKNEQDNINREKIKEANKVIAEKNAEIARLKAEYAAEREALKASGEAKQADYQQLKKAHEAALADLAKAQQDAARVPVLVDQVRAIEAQAATARQGRDEAMGKVAQQATEIEQLKGQAAKVPGLVDQVRAIEAQAATAQQQAKQVPRLEQQAQELAQLKTQYQRDLEALKASGEATQRDYQQLKQQHEAALAKLATAQQEAAKVPVLVDQVRAIEAQAATAQQQAKQVPGLEQQAAQQAQELAQLKTQYQRDREALKASGEATQRDYQQLKQQHEAALAKLASTEEKAAQVPGLEQQLKASQQEAINTKLTADERYKNLRGQALEIQAERNELAKKVATLSVAPPAQTLAAPAQPERPAPRPVPVTPTVQAPAQPASEIWPRLTADEFRELPKRRLGDQLIDAAREVLVMCVEVADAAGKHKLFPGQLRRALESLLENYREPPTPEPTKQVPEQQPLAAAHARTQTPTPSRGGLGR